MKRKSGQNQTIHCNRFINLCELCCVWSCSVVPRHYSKSKMSFNQTLKSKYNIRSIIASRRFRNDTCSLKSRLRCRLFNETFESISSATDNDATVVFEFNDFMCGVFHLTQTATIFGMEIRWFDSAWQLITDDWCFKYLKLLKNIQKIQIDGNFKQNPITSLDNRARAKQSNRRATRATVEISWFALRNMTSAIKNDV